MLEQIRQWFKPPIFPNEEDKTRSAQILHALLKDILILLLFGILGTIFFYANKVLLSVMIFTLFTGILILHVLIKRGHVLNASRLFVGGLWLLASISILLTGRFNTTLVSLQLVVTVLASVLLGRRSAIIFTLLSVFGGLGLAVLEGAGYSFNHPFPLPPLASWFTWALTFALIMTSLNPTIQSLNQSTEKLRDSETKFRAIFENSIDAIGVSKLAEHVFVNPAYIALFGYDNSDELIGKPILDLIAPNNREQIIQYVHRRARGEPAPSFYETRGLKKNGTPFDLEVHVSTFELRNKLFTLVIERDITERKDSEKALRDSEARNRAILNALPDLMFVQNRDGTYLDYHAANERDLYTSPEQFLGKRMHDVLSENLADTLLGSIEQAIITGETQIVDYELNITGQIRFFEARIMKQDNNKVVSMIREITERKQAEEALRASEERLKFVLEGSQLGYWDWNIETGQVQRNARWAEMLGYTLEEIEFTVEQWTDLHHPDDCDHAWQSLQEHLEGRTPEYRIEYRMRTKDGQYKWILDQAKVVKRDHQGKPLRMSGTHTDITERKQTENIIQARLRVNEFARDHSLDELLQNALDELCALTDSPIGQSA